MNEKINEYIEDLLEVACCPNHDYSCRQVYEYVKQLQSNWNSLREWLKNKIDNFQDDVSEPILHEQMTVRVVYKYMENLDKMNELEGVDNENNNIRVNNFNEKL